MNAKGKTLIKKRNTKLTATALMRPAGGSAILAGLCFIIVGMFHPENVPSSVITAGWVNVHIAATALGFFGLFGMAGLYARQKEKIGWLGLAGLILFSGWFVIISVFSYVEAFVLPRLAIDSPKFVEGFLGMFTGIPSEVDLGVLPTVWNVSGPMLILGALLFGIATFSARVLPRWAGGFLTLAAILIPVSGIFPMEYQAKIAMIPFGLAMAWLGYALFAEHGEKTSEVVKLEIPGCLRLYRRAGDPLTACLVEYLRVIPLRYIGDNQMIINQTITHQHSARAGSTGPSSTTQTISLTLDRILELLSEASWKSS